MARRVVAAVEDLLFRSKISETAEQLGIEASFPRSPKKLTDAIQTSPPDLLILDLNSSRFEPLRVLQTVKSGEATGASCRSGGMAGREPMFQMCSRKAWLV